MSTFVGYVRVSRVAGRTGDSFQSPRQQTDQIQGWADAHGHLLSEVVTELDVSGGRALKDRELERLVRLVESGDAEGIIVARLDRFARSLLHGLGAIDRIEKAGGVFVAVQDGFDLSTPTGRLVLRIMLSLAEFELDRIRGTFKASKADAVKRGLTVSSVAAFGYRRPGKGRPLQVVESEAEWVRRIFARRAAGDGWAKIAGELEAAGVQTRYGSSTWANRALRGIVRNRVYLGEARLVLDRSTGDEITTRDAHPAIVSHQVWEQANRITGPAFTPNPQTVTDRSVLRGLLRCAGCRGSMRWELRGFASGREWLVSCRNAAGGDTARGCPEPAYIRGIPDIERLIVTEVLAAIDALEVTASGVEEDDAAATARRALDQAVVARDEWRDNLEVQAAVGMQQYVQGLRVRQTAVEEAEQAAAAVEVPVGLRRLHVGLRKRWDSMTVPQQADVLEGLLVCVMVRRGSAESRGAVKDRLRVVWRGEDVELPTRGRRMREVLGPFRWDADLDTDAGVVRGQ